MIDNVKYLLLAFVSLSLGCGGAPNQAALTELDLKTIALQYHQYYAETGSPPGSFKELIEFDDGFSSLPGNAAVIERTKQAIASGNYVVLWGYDVSVDLDANSSVILAYHKDAPDKGGVVAFADGSARHLTQDEFRSFTKANEVPN